MLVLDGLRPIEGSKKGKRRRLVIPQFHLGHLGFVPNLGVYFRSEQHVPQDYGDEITITPFQGAGGRQDIFLLKCVFNDGPGVVLNALAAFAALRINVVSLESATMHANRRHTLYCILSWSASSFPSPVPLDKGTSEKFFEYLHQLPTNDWRYLLLVETLVVFCGKSLEYEQDSDGAWIPNIRLRLYDAFQGAEANGRLAKIGRSGPAKQSTVFLDLDEIFGSRHALGSVIFFSETETKTLRLIFPSQKRDGRFLHIGFVHNNRFGALLAIARLINACGFNILTSLLRNFGKDQNVWELILEYVGPNTANGKVLPIKPKMEGVRWFKDWCFNDYNKKKPGGTLGLMRYMRGYEVKVRRPDYPRSPEDTEKDFPPPTDILPRSRTTPSATVTISEDEVDSYIDELKTWQNSRDHTAAAAESTERFQRDLERHITHREHRGTVFVSLGLNAKHLAMKRLTMTHLALIKKRFRDELQLDTTDYTDVDSKPVRAESLERIRKADFVLGMWRKDSEGLEISPWMNFEHGAADFAGKKPVLMVHRKLGLRIPKRTTPEIVWQEYDDKTFEDDLTRVIKVCRNTWLRGTRHLMELDKKTG